MFSSSDPLSQTSPPDAALRAEAQIGRYLRLAAALVAILVIGLGGWSATTLIGGAVIAPGLIAVESDSKSVQHLEGGIISEIRIRDGDQVAAGEALVLLDAGQLREQVSGLEAQIRAASEESGLLSEELQDVAVLEQKGLVTKTRITALKRQLTKIEGERGRLVAELALVKGRVARYSVRAPISGTIHNLAFRTIGGVVAPGQEILKIVPTADRLIVAARLDPADIDQVVRGQLVSVRLTGLNLSTTPELAGAVDTVSADLSFDETLRISFYEVRISLDGEQPAGFESVRLVPGMPADAFIRTRPRTVLNYLVQPITEQLNRAFRED